MRLERYGGVAMMSSKGKCQRIWMILLLMVFVMMLSIPSEATGPLYKTTRASKMTNKFLRGLLNVPLCVMEIPRSLNENIKNTDYFTGTFVGLGEGIFKSAKRLTFGVYEVSTFPAPEWGLLNTWVDDPIPFKELTE